jgi:hypothetical protein
LGEAFGGLAGAAGSGVGADNVRDDGFQGSSLLVGLGVRGPEEAETAAGVAGLSAGSADEGARGVGSLAPFGEAGKWGSATAAWGEERGGGRSAAAPGTEVDVPAPYLKRTSPTPRRTPTAARA